MVARLKLALPFAAITLYLSLWERNRVMDNRATIPTVRRFLRQFLPACLFLNLTDGRLESLPHMTVYLLVNQDSA